METVPPAGPRYPLPLKTISRLALAALAGRRLAFSTEARYCTGLLRPPLQVLGQEHIPSEGPAVIVINHYSRPGFHAWWQVLSVSAVVPLEIHWIITAALTRPGFLGELAWIPATRWVLKRVAQVYGFANMPPMPPRPQEVAARTQAVRDLLGFARAHPRSLIGLAPEGADAPGGVLQLPPLGAGRLMLHLAELGFPFHPAGIFEQDGCLFVHFGEQFRLSAIVSEDRQVRDRLASRQVMEKIGTLLPDRLRLR